MCLFFSWYPDFGSCHHVGGSPKQDTPIPLSAFLSLEQSIDCGRFGVKYIQRQQCFNSQLTLGSAPLGICVSGPRLDGLGPRSRNVRSHEPSEGSNAESTQKGRGATQEPEGQRLKAQPTWIPFMFRMRHMSPKPLLCKKATSTIRTTRHNHSLHSIPHTHALSLLSTHSHSHTHTLTHTHTHQNNKKPPEKEAGKMNNHQPKTQINNQTTTGTIIIIIIIIIILILLITIIIATLTIIS